MVGCMMVLFVVLLMVCSGDGVWWVGDLVLCWGVVGGLGWLVGVDGVFLGDDGVGVVSWGFEVGFIGVVGCIGIGFVVEVVVMFGVWVGVGFDWVFVWLVVWLVE